MSTVFHRYVALGDSFTEGVGDDDPQRPNGVRGWADRVAEVLAAQVEGPDDFGYANLAIRGRKLGPVVAEQLEPALALRPDLVTLYAGANDVLRPRVDLDDLAHTLDDAVRRLAASGATVALFTPADVGSTSIYAPLRGRMALLAEAVRESADRHGAVVVDMWRMRDHTALDWSADRMHLGPGGHQRMAVATLDALGVPHDLVPSTPDAPPARTSREVRRENLEWARRHLLPWVHRRVTGRSSGDSIDPRRPGLAPIEPVRPVRHDGAGPVGDGDVVG